jgi:hypothetical protein
MHVNNKEVPNMNEKTKIYEPPVLVKVGEAQDAIRGAYGCGYDLDGTFIGSGQEFQSDLERKS